MRTSSSSLPPQVEGPAKGRLTVGLGPLAWEGAAPGPSGVAVAVRWWGDDGPGDLLHLNSASSTALQFHLRSGPKYVARYLRDAGSLALLLKQLAPAGSGGSAASAILGTASVDVAALGAGTPLAATLPVVGDQGRVVAQLPVILSLAFTNPAVSSFELNEHLAAVEAAAAAAATAASPVAAAAAAQPAVGGPDAAGAAAAQGVVQPGVAGVAAAVAAADAMLVAEEEPVLCCPVIFEQLEEARHGGSWEELQRRAASEGGALGAAEIEGALRQLLPRASDGAVSFARTAVDVEQHDEPWTLDALAEAIRECADVERSLRNEPGAAARRLQGLVSLLAGRHLEVQKAFCGTGSGRDQGLSYPQLVSVLRALSPGATRYEVRCLLAALAGMDEAGTGRVTLPQLRQAVAAFSFAQAYPTEDEERQQQAAAAARAAKAAAAAAAALADVRERRPPGTPLAAAGCQSDSARRCQTARKSETTVQQRGHASSGSVQLPPAVAEVAASAQPQQASAAHAVPEPLSGPSQASWPAARLGQPAPILLSAAATGAAGGLAVGVPVGSDGWQQACQEARGVGSGVAGSAGMPLQQGPVIGWPLRPAASYTQPQQPWAAQHQLPQQSALVAQPAGADPLQALISRAEQLQQAMSRAAFNPSLPLLGLAPGSSGGGSSSHEAPGMMVSLRKGSLLPIGAAPCLQGQQAVQPALESAASGNSSRTATVPAACLPADVLGTAAADGADPAGSLSAASAALIEAARALSRGRQASAVAAGAPAPAAAGSAAAGSFQPDSLPAAHTGAGGSTGAGEAAAQQPLLKVAPDTASELSWDDPAELAEDIILQELFFSRPAQCIATAEVAAGSPGLRAAPRPSAPVQPEGAAMAASAVQQHQHPVAEYVLSLRLGALRLRQQHGQRQPATSHTQPAGGTAAATMPQPLVSRAVRVRGVVKQLHPSAQPVQFVLAAGGPASGKGAAAVRFEGPHASTVQLEVPVPAACVEQGRLPSTLFIEVWDQADKLVGIVRAPLSLCLLPDGTGQLGGQGVPGASLPAVVCEGRWDVWNVLEGRAEGSLELFAAVQERGEPPVAPATRHAFSVTIQTAYRLPGSAAYAEAELQGPDARYIKYTFPGEPEPLFTKDVPVMSNPTFDASARHCITLTPEQDIATVLASGGSRRLRFELWDCWVDGQQQLHAWAELPMAELAALAQAPTAAGGAAAGAEEGSADAHNGGGAAAASVQSRLLPLITEYDTGGAGLLPGAAAEAAAAHKGPALRVDLSYEAERVLVPVLPEAKRPLLEQNGGELGRTAAAEVPAARKPAAAHHIQQQQAAAAAAAASPKHRLPASHPRQQPAVGAATDGRSAGAAVGPSATVAHTGAGSCARGWEDGAENDVLLANSSPVGPVRTAVPAAKGVEATLCVEIIRACGLAAAVKEACAFGGGSAALNRARQVGAHPFVRLSLFPTDAALQRRAPPLQTPFQAQTFCPEFNARHEYRVRLDARMVHALAEQELQLEVWHHLPRAQAVAAALSAGRSSVAAGTEAAGPSGGEREVLLGTASVPLANVLLRPQGFRGWLGLKSRRGEAVGAVQLAVHLSELDGQPLFASTPDRSPLLQCEGAADLIPSHLSWLLGGSVVGCFRGQLAIATVALEELVPPLQDSSGRDADRPRADLYFASYRLPGAAGSHATTARTLTAASSRVPGAAVAAAAGALPGQAWSAKLGHLGTFQVAAGPALCRALASSPLSIDVYRQAAPGAKPGRPAAAVPLPQHIGTAEVDLSGLLWARQQRAKGGPRTVSGSFPVVDPSAKSLGGARVRVRVCLDLCPGCEPSAAATPAPHGWSGAAADSLEGVWEVEGEEGPPAWQQQEEACEPVAPSTRWHSVGGPAVPAHGQRGSSTSGSPLSEQRLSRSPGACSPPDAALPEALLAAQPPGAGGVHLRGGSGGSSSGTPAAGGSSGTPAAGGSSGTPAAGGSLGPAQASGPTASLTANPSPAGAAGGKPSSGAPATPGVAPGELPPSATDPLPGKLLIHIESAVHLPNSRPGSAAGRQGSNGGGSGSSTSRGAEYDAFVSLTWGPHKAKYSTAAVAVAGLGGPPGGSASWDEVVAVEAEASMFPGVAGQPAGAQPPPGNPTPAGGPVLLLNLWSCPPAAGGTAAGQCTSTPPPGGPRVASPLPAAGGHALVGCAAVDLTALPLLGEVAGYYNIVSYQQQVRGQLRLAVRLDEVLAQQLQAARRRGPAVVSAAAAVPSSSREERGQPAPAAVATGPLDTARADPGPEPAASSQPVPPAVPQPEAAAANPQSAAAEPLPSGNSSGPEGGAEEGEEGESMAGGLMGELQSRMQALQLLSQRLSREPSAAGEPAAGGAACGRDSSMGEEEAQAGGQQQHGQPAAAGVGEGLALREIDASDEEGEGGAWFLGRSGPRPRGGMAWSGSDSDDDAMALVGIAFEGAVSPGGSDDEDVTPPGRPPAGPRQSALMTADWMFDISRLPPVTLGAGGATDVEQHPSAAGEALDSEAAPRRVSFQNVLLPAVVTQQEERQRAAEAAAAAHSTADHPPGQASGAAVPREHEPPSGQRPLPVLPQQQAPSTAATATAAPPALPTGRSGILLGAGVGLSAQGHRDDWLFDISKPPPTTRGAQPQATEVSGGREGGGAALHPFQASARPAGLPTTGGGGSGSGPGRAAPNRPPTNSFSQYLTLQPQPSAPAGAAGGGGSAGPAALCGEAAAAGAATGQPTAGLAGVSGAASGQAQ